MESKDDGAREKRRDFEIAMKTGKHGSWRASLLAHVHSLAKNQPDLGKASMSQEFETDGESVTR